MKAFKNSKEYIIDLNKTRSIRALVAAIVVSLFTFIAVTGTVKSPYYVDESTFHFFTTISNLISAAGAMLMIPYAVEGIRKKRFTMPRWLSLFQYAGAVSVFITMVCASTIITITLGPVFAFSGQQFWLHLVVPISAIILFLAVESGHYLTKRDMVIAQIPFWIYAAVYLVMVVIVGKENGGWGDIYHATTIVPVWMAFGMLMIIGFAAAVFLRFIHNRTVDKGLRQLSARWDKDTDPVELKIEAFGLGRYMAGHLDKSEIIIPMDIFQLMSEKCGVPIDDLVKAYTKGVLSESTT